MPAGRELGDVRFERGHGRIFSVRHVSYIRGFSAANMVLQAPSAPPHDLVSGWGMCTRLSKHVGQVDSEKKWKCKCEKKVLLERLRIHSANRVRTREPRCKRREACHSTTRSMKLLSTGKRTIYSTNVVSRLPPKSRLQTRSGMVRADPYKSIFKMNTT